ncbi:GNAT family N-acetyltransferase [Tsuneonella amylolytica]|uniref:GNAT family N-acetyltransferase n=1 Tax=Tsuneonella amylolytica TaxID=2338327 RepID=UPI000EAA1964|nr:N-acetyltransferase [Tsuneonella amylolytica]
MPSIVPLSAVEPQLVEDLLDAAFGTDRHGRTAYTIRAAAEWLPALSFAALDDGEYLVATIQLWPVALTDPQGRAHPLLMVGPVAVMPAHQGEGYGKALIEASLGAIDPAAALPQVLIGDAPYYERFGFVEAPGGWRCPGPWDPARLLVRCDNRAVLPPGGMLGPWSTTQANPLAD